MVLAVGMWRKSLWPTGWLVGWLAGWLAGLFSRGLEQTTTNATWLATQDTYIQTATTAATATNCLCFYGKNIFETTTQVDDIKTKTSLWFHRKNDAPPRRLPPKPALLQHLWPGPCPLLLSCLLPRFKCKCPAAGMGHQMGDGIWELCSIALLFYC